MHDLFVSPKIVIKDPKHAENRNSKEIEIRSFSDFFINDGNHCKNIFLVGEPGSGKSTFIQYFALQWSKLHLLPSPDCSGDCHREDGFQDQETLSQIEFLFYLSLRDANHYCSYEDIIQDQLLRHIYTPADQERACCIVQSVLESPTACIASDGLDEWAHPTQGSCRCPSKVKGRTPVICQPHSATIVTTSRPWRLAQLPPMDSKIEKRMDIEGTGNVDELGKKIVTVLNKKADEQLDYTTFKQCVRKQKVAHLLHTPILLLQLVCLLFDGKGIPNSQCKIYASIIDMLIGRKSQQHLEGRSVHQTTLQVFSDMMNIRKHCNHFIDIAKVAFEQLFPKQGHAAIVFNSNSCSLSEESKTFARECGLLTEKKSKSFSARSSHFSFTHKSFQEFFAAIYLSEHEELFETVIGQRYQPHSEDEFSTCINDLAQVFVFMAGINAKLAEKMSILMNSHLATMDLEELSVNYSPSDYLTRLMTYGILEADSNGLHDITLCLHYVNLYVKTSDDVDNCRRLHSMNKGQLVLLSVKCYGCKNDEGARVHVNLNDLTDVVSIQTCTQLRYLTLEEVDLGEHGLVLPDNITHVELNYVTMTGGLSVQHYTQLQHLSLLAMQFDDNFPQLPNAITFIKLRGVTLPVRGVLGLLEQLENLPHAVTCELEYCIVEPYSERGQVEHRLKTSTSLQFDGYRNTPYGMSFNCWKKE